MKLIALVLGLVSAGCAASTPPSVSTLPERRQFLATQISDALASQMNCPNADLRYVSTEKLGSIADVATYRDYYVAEGCGQRSDFVTEVRRIGTSMPPEIQQAVLVPSIEQYRVQAHEQSTKNAAFELGCPDLKSVDLNEQLGVRHASYDASIGEEGCGKRATYHTHCNAGIYSAGTQPISCSSKQDLAAVVQ